MSVLALIPARAGSKGISHKNVRLFRGKPLLAHSIEQALVARNVDRVIVSTDSEEYAALARSFGAETPFLRPAAFAGDLSPDVDVFRHALAWLTEHQGYRSEICVHLRPTYPTRTVADIEGAVDLLLANPRADSVRSVTPAPHTPYKMWRLCEGGQLIPLLSCDLPEPYNLPRQALPPVYLQNAAVDVVRSRVIVEQGSMTGRTILAFVMPECLDIDTAAQFDEAAVTLGGALPTGKTFVFDIDGVIAGLVPDGDYARAMPNHDAIAIVNRLFEAGNTIVLHTARGSATRIDWQEMTRRQLAEWGVRHHQLHFGKPAGDFYVDDHMVPLGALLRWIGGAANGT